MTRPLHEFVAHPLFQAGTLGFPSHLDAALIYGARRWAVFPVSAIENGACSCGTPECKGKHPHELALHGFKDATTDPDVIRAWWTQAPTANIGLRTGTESGIVVVDVDPRHGGDKTMRELEAEHGRLPVTLVSVTGGGGAHYFFRSLGVEFRSKNNALGSGIDVKGDGGYVVAPPSNHISGGIYHWSDYGVPLADLPRAWERLLLSPPKKTAAAGANGHGGKITEGGRETFLVSLAGSLRLRGMSVEGMRTSLGVANQEQCDPPVSDADLDRIAGSIGKKPPGPRGTMPSGDLPLVMVLEGEHPRATDETEAILLPHAEEEGMFQRAGELVRVIALDKATTSAGLARPAGTVMLQPVTLPILMEIAEKHIAFYMTKRGKPTRINCPARMGTAYLSRGKWKLSTLTGIITAPIMRLDGTILDETGYDQDTELYFAGEAFALHMNPEPSLADAQRALAILCAPFAQFPFCNEEDRAVAIAAILTALERRLLAACPLFGYSAPTQRSGKTLLAEAAAILAIGKPAPASAVSPDREEFRKGLTSALREGQACINLDNIEHPLKSPDLAKIITQPEFQDRVLGETKNLRLPTNVHWAATGNNLTFRGDLATRALLCRIDANLERPEQRDFAIPDLKAYLLEHRAELVAAGLTILRAYYVAGRPQQKLSRWGGFDQWSDFIRAPLVWAGLTDPCLTRETVIGEDPEKESASEALTELKAVFGDGQFSAKEAAEKANDQTLKTYAFPELHDALSTVTGGDKTIDSSRLGKWFRMWRDRFVDGVKLVRANSEGTSAAKWRVA